MTRLALSVLDRLPAEIARPEYRIGEVGIGVVHFGPGAFFRAHQAVYFDDLLKADNRWGICGVSLHSSSVREALQPQDGLYTLAILDAAPRLRVIGSLREVLVAAEEPDSVLARLASPAVRLVTLTITEKGYGLDRDGALDLTDGAIRHDLDNADAVPKSAIGWLVKGLGARRAAGIPAFVTLSCDNLTDNGGKLGRATAAFARASGDEALAAWIEANARFPRTMVDSITPATDDALRRSVAESIGVDDAWPIQREAFTQWVIEDALGNDAPDLASVGATLTTDVGLFERAKLRLLNAAHSSLAYIGRLAGLETVTAAMATPALAVFVEKLMREDIAPTLKSGSGLDLAVYIDAVLARFSNPALRHELAQIACDGSLKLPMRLLATIEDTLAAGRPVSRLAVPVAAWMVFVRAQIASDHRLSDPLAATLRQCVSGRVEDDVERFLLLRQVFSPGLGTSGAFANAVHAAHTGLRADGLNALR